MILQLWVAISVAALIVVLVFESRRSPILLVLGTGIVILIAWESPTTPLIASVGGVQIYLADAMSLLLFGVVALDATTRSMVSGVGFLTIALVTLFAQSFLRGLFQYGTTAFVEFRLVLPILAVWLWLRTLQPGERKSTLVPFLYTTAWALVVVAGIHLALYGPGNASDFVQTGDGEDQVSRVLVSGQALVLLAAVTHILTDRSAKLSGKSVALLSFASATVILSQQRTVWLCGAIAIAVCLLFGSSQTRKRVAALACVSLVAVTVYIALDQGNSLIRTLAESTSNAHTYDSRVLGWTELIRAQLERGPAIITFGQPFGSGFARAATHGNTDTFNPHNWYLFVFLRAGALGLAAYVLGLVAAIVLAIRDRNAQALALLTVLAIYSWTYNPPWYFLMFCASTALFRRPELGGWRSQLSLTSRPRAAPMSFEPQSDRDSLESKFKW